MLRDLFTREIVVKEWVYRSLWGFLIVDFILDLFR